MSISGSGEYTFESVAYAGFFLSFDPTTTGLILVQVFGASYQDPRQRFALFASRSDLQTITFDFDSICPINSPSCGDSRVISTSRVQLSHLQVIRIERPSTVFTAEFQIDHLGEVPLLTRF